MSRHDLRGRLAVTPEAAVVVLACAGDPDAFRELVLRREAWLRDLLRRLCGDAALADDLAQQALLQAWKTLPSLRQASAFGGWLRRLAVNVWLQQVRRGRAPEDELTDAISETLPDPLDRSVGAPDRIDLERALAKLRPGERLCVVLSFAEGLSHGEIAETAGLPLGTVKSHVTRGGAKLRAMLGVGECA